MFWAGCRSANRSAGAASSGQAAAADGVEASAVTSVTTGDVYRAFSNCRDPIYLVAFESRVDLNVLLEAEYQWPNIENVFAVLQSKFTGRELLRIYDYCIKHQYPRAPADGYHKGPGRPKKVGAKVGNRNAAGAQKKAAHIVVNNPKGKKEVVLK